MKIVLWYWPRVPNPWYVEEIRTARRNPDIRGELWGVEITVEQAMRELNRAIKNHAKRSK